MKINWLLLANTSCVCAGIALSKWWDSSMDRGLALVGAVALILLADLLFRKAKKDD